MKLIGLDYDNTYSDDPELFEMFIEAAQRRGHLVFIVTARPETQPVPVRSCEVFYTEGAPKAPFMRERGLDIDIWVDDWPEIIGQTRV
jgi:hypothetical protein